MPNNKLVYLARRSPGVSREDWPKTWKSHAIFASQFSVAGSRIEWMRYCNRIDAPEIDGAAVELPMVSTAHDGVALINNGQSEPSLSPLPDDVRSALDTDELRVFDQLVTNFAFPCVETLILDGLPGKAAVYIFLPSGDLKARLDGAHADLVRATLPELSGLTRYAHNHPIQIPAAPFDFGAIVEMWFATPDDAARALKDGTLQPVLDDLGTFADMEKAVVMLTSPCHAYPKDEVLAERATA
ncbi:MAG: EthD domain-containing protein [Novosphingobium sp.]|nr:EthD domain-containing protein [Novosphingobium sp.]